MTDVRVTEKVEIDRPPEDVWAVVADLDTHTVWRPALVEFRQTSEGPLGEGSTIREVLSWRGREIVIDDVVTLFEPGRRLAIRGGWKAADFELELLLEPTSTGGTLVKMDWPLYPKSLAMRLAAPFLRGAMRKATAEEAEGLKAYVEEERGANR